DPLLELDLHLFGEFSIDIQPTSPSKGLQI
ncbi:MAG: hypothetical protein ACI9Q4_001846, partial [Sediminicola sp.]